MYSNTTIEQHKQVIIDALNVAVKSGCFTIYDCSQVIESLNAILAMPNVESLGITPVDNEEE